MVVWQCYNPGYFNYLQLYFYTKQDCYEKQHEELIKKPWKIGPHIGKSNHAKHTVSVVAL